jgi:hypothetical protein
MIGFIENFFTITINYSANTNLHNSLGHAPFSSCFYQLTLAESHVATDSQSASLSWNKAPTWGLRPDFYYCLTVAGLLIWGALSEEKTGLSFTIAAGLASAVIFGVKRQGARS